MATGALNAKGVWIYGEDDSETTFSALLNKLGNSISNTLKGRIVQIVYAETSTQLVLNSTTYTDIGLSATITPTNASNKVYVFANLNGLGKDPAGSVNQTANVQLLRGTTQIGAAKTAYTNSIVYDLGNSVSFSIQDSPATTSATIYKAQLAAETTGPVRANYAAKSTILLVEVQA